ncbi:hypothetical protein ABZ070_34820 [Streptomyces sp. NPDC006283]|uniref:hypothetical protein n=1 Tax=Streptomyces sp. NPDC006283 TaxID=3156741 RepID=UPI0033A6EF26
MTHIDPKRLATRTNSPKVIDAHGTLNTAQWRDVGYQQLTELLEGLITEGSLPLGVKVPSARQIAEQYGFSHQCVLSTPCASSRIGVGRLLARGEQPSSP